ncbi:MAG: RNA polymerase sigma factor [Anaerolineales bacterium]
MPDIDELLGQYSADDPRLIEALVLDHYDFVYRIALSILNDRHEADDAAQETFIKAVANLDNYQPGSRLKSWLATIAVNVCRGMLRKQKTRQNLQRVLKLAGFSSREQSTPEQAALQKESIQALRRAVQGLGEKHRLPVILRYVNGLTVPEIASIMNLSQGTVHSRLFYAHRKLRAQLGTNYGSSDSSIEAKE